MTQATAQNSSSFTVGIIGGGIAGSTIALHLAQLGINVSLIESGPSLVNGPPICHLHAGGNLYREISQEQCLTLLKQSIEMLKLYPLAADYRPTVIAIPQRDKGAPHDLYPRLNELQKYYRDLVTHDASNQVLGEPSKYYQTFSKFEVEQLATQATVALPKSLAQWLIPVAKALDLNQLKFPLIMVQEYGLSVFRLAASASLTLEDLACCDINLKSKVTALTHQNSKWHITSTSESTSKTMEVDYLINACGFQTGIIDDLIGEHRERMVEFKAAYITKWDQCTTIWPEVIFYGERGTPNGMAQLTPYPGGYFQIHGMTQDITLFKQGLVTSNSNSAQPILPKKYLNKISQQWPKEIIEQRTERSITFMAQFIPAFNEATLGGDPLFGAQQIPGLDPTLRAADVSFGKNNYARCEIVKASSALCAASLIIEKLNQLHLFSPPAAMLSPLRALNEHQVTTLAEQLAQERGYPITLAHRNTPQG